MSTRWIVTPRPNRTAALRLICVPPAGGGLLDFRGWGDRLGAVEVAVVELPGRGSHRREPALESLPHAADAVTAAILSEPARPLVLFGHGVGALIAFEVTRRLESRHAAVAALFLSAQRHPSLTEPAPSLSTLPEAQFIAEAQRRYQVIPPEAFVDPDLMRQHVAQLRADVLMLDRYRYQAGEPLRCPIVACCGSADPQASPAEMQEWRRETTGRFSVHTFSGGHLYLQREQKALTTLMANQASVILGALGRLTPVL